MRLKPATALVVGLVLLFVLGRVGPRPTLKSNAPPRHAVQPESSHMALSSTTSMATAALTPALPKWTNSLESFEAWLQSYLSAPDDERSRAEPIGLELARARRAALRELIENDPERAWESRIRWAARKELPRAIQEQLEEMVSARGDLAVLGAIPYANQKTEFRPIIRWATFGEKSYTAFAYGRHASQSTRRNISLHGIAIDGALAVMDSPLRVLDPGEPPRQGKTSAADSCPVSGKSTGHSPAAGAPVTVESGDEVFRLCEAAHAAALGNELWQQEAALNSPQAFAGTGSNSVLVMLVDFPDRPGANTTPSEALSVMNEVSEFYRACSFQQLFLEPIAITSVLRLPRASTEYAQASPSLLLNDARAVAALSGYDGSRYRFDIVTFHHVGFPWGGLGYIGDRGAFAQGPAFLARTVEHELGHNFGLWHAGGWVAYDESIIGPGHRLEYGHEFDIMGSGLGHLNAAFKAALGWLDEANIATSSMTGFYRLHAMDSEAPLDSSRAYALRVPGSPFDYWIEFRQQFTNNPLVMSGALVHWATDVAGPDQCQLLDMNPGGVSGFRDAPLLAGRTFADTAHGIFITPLAKGGNGADSWLDIDVRFRPTNTSSPILSLAASAAAVDPGEAVQFTTTASDVDGDTLAFHWDFGDRSVPESSLNQPAASKSWAVAGEYVVRCTVSDMKGGEASASVLLRVGNPMTFRVSGRIFLQGSPMHGVHVHNGLSGSDYRGALTGSDGQFTITGLSAGSYAIVAVKAGYFFEPLFANPVNVGPTNVEGLVFGTIPPGTLRITGFTPTTGIAGSEVTIRGMNFAGSSWYLSEVRFGALPAVFRRVPTGEIIATVPPGAVTAPIVLLTSSGMIDTSSIPFTVWPSLPVFLSSPRSQTNFANWPITFAATATGSGPLWWQWRKDRVAIPDATNATYSLFSPQLNDAGLYDAVLRNPVGSVTSAGAVLTIWPAPTLAEALDTDGLLWTTGGQRLWLPQTNLTHDWIDAVENANLAGGFAESWLETLVTVPEPTVLRFWCLLTNSASLTLLSGIGTNFTTLWGGSGPYGVWQEGSVLLPTGSQTLRWRSGFHFSSSKVWLDSVRFVTGGPPSIVEQPLDQAVALYRSATFSVQADGTAPLRYQWYRSSGSIVQSIVGANSPTFTLPSVTQGEQFWQYWAVVANDFGAVTSRFARASVFLPPAVSILSPTDDSVVRAGAVEVRISASSAYPVTLVELVDDDTGVWLGATNAPASDGSYIITFNAAPGSRFDLMARATNAEGQTGDSWTVDFNVLLSPVPLGAEWRYLDTGANLGTAWRTATFDDSAWRKGPAQLGFGEGDEATILASNRQVTTYFRHHFLVNDPDGVYQLLLRLRRDDGAIVYLNDAELLRDNITNAAVNSTTLAFLAADDGTMLHEFELPPALLVTGTNLLAVELHQSSVNSSDLSFDLGLDLVWFGNRTRGVWITLSGSPSDPFIAPQPITLGAEAVAGGTLGLARVEFRANGVRLGGDTARPWSFTWSNAPAGPQELTAVAFDTMGASITSAPVAIWIVPPPTATALVSFGEDWQYLDSGFAPDYDWFWNSGYDDSSWAAGPGRLGYGGDGEATTIGFGPDPNTKYITSWFRKKFYTTEAQDFSALKLRVVRDDGVLVFLNGRQLLRDNLLSDYSDPTSFAATVVGGAVETTPIEVVIPSWQPDFDGTYLRYGENLLAVEVHQATATSSDLGFDLALSGLKDTSYAPATLLTAPADGEKFAGPVPISAYVVGASNVQRVEFFVDGITLGETASITASAATITWTNPPHGVHEISARSHLDDGSVLSAAPVTITTLPPGFSTPLIFANEIWRYLDTGANLGAAWRTPGFNDSAWPNGPAPLGFGDPGMTTTLRAANAAGQRIITYYFRQRFTVPSDFVVTNLQMRIQRDDAVVVYLNGGETFRDTNMPSGDITFTTRARTALGGIDETAWCTAKLNTAGLVSGTNVLAVELHQASTNSSDAAFALELRGRGYRFSAPTPPVPPLLQLSRNAAGALRATFPVFNGNTFVIEASSDLRTWTSIATNTASNGLFEAFAAPSASVYQFFRARWQPRSLEQ